MDPPPPLIAEGDEGLDALLDSMLADAEEGDEGIEVAFGGELEDEGDEELDPGPNGR
jgi:hypothetical protein